MMEQIIDDPATQPSRRRASTSVAARISIRHSLLVFTSRISTLNSLALAPR